MNEDSHLEAAYEDRFVVEQDGYDYDDGYYDDDQDNRD